MRVSLGRWRDGGCVLHQPPVSDREGVGAADFTAHTLERGVGRFWRCYATPHCISEGGWRASSLRDYL
jgi:hypothetical protein